MKYVYKILKFKLLKHLDRQAIPLSRIFLTIAETMNFTGDNAILVGPLDLKT